MTKRWMRRLLPLLACGFVISAAPPERSSAQTVEQFYKGRNVTLIVGTAPGGINDISARLTAKHLPRFIPGNPHIIVQNVPGGGGVVTANRLYNTVEKDGSVIAKIERAVPQFAMQGMSGVSFDPLKYTWLGSLSSYANDAYVLLVNASHPAKTAADLFKPDVVVILGGDAGASSNQIFALIAKDVLGMHVNLIRGYTGAAPLFLAMQGGELDGQVIGLSSIKAAQRPLFDQGAFRPLVQFGRTTRLPELKDVPTGRELTSDPQALSLLEFAEMPFFMALPFAAPPGIPPDRAKALQTAFADMCKDPVFLQEADRIGFDISPIGADEMSRLLVRAAATPKEVIDRFNDLVAPTRK